MFAKTLFGLAISVAATTAAMGQSINIDFNTATGLGGGVPAITYGAASGSAGVWNSVGSMSANVPTATFLNLAGGATTATLTSSGAEFTFNGSGNGAPVGNDALLLQDILDLGGTGASNTFTFNGLQNAIYNVYVYAMAPDSSTFLTNVNVNGGANQVVGGLYTGVFTLGVTHALFNNVSVVGGSMTIGTSTNSGFGSLAGIQLVLVPGPSGLALLGLTGLVSRRRRRD